MAKLINCEFCGKEIKKGFLGLIGDAKTLWLGDEFVTCCPECLKKYKDFAKNEGARFSAKLKNMGYKSYSDEGNKELLKLFNIYYEESKIYNHGNRNYSGYFMFDGNAKKNEINILTTAEKVVSKKAKPLDMLETTKDLLADEIIFMANGGKSIPWRFTDDDISVIEYVVGKDTMANGCQICTLTIKLNDYNKMTYKPCVIEGVISYKTKIFGQEKVQREKVEEILTMFKKEVGVGHIPHVEVKSI